MSDQKRYTIPELADRLAQVCAIDERLANIEREIQNLRHAIERLPRPNANESAHTSGQPKMLFSTEDTAAALSCSRVTVLKLIQQGYLPAKRNGRMIRILRKDVEALAKAGLPSVWSTDKPWPHERKKV